LVFKKNANFFAENWEKSPKIVIITSTPELAANKVALSEFATCEFRNRNWLKNVIILSWTNWINKSSPQPPEQKIKG
jgi:hypothetical protein